MNRVLQKKVSIPFTIIGIPIKGFYTPFVSAQSNISCTFIARIERSSKSYERTLDYRHLDVSTNIVNYVGMVLDELGYRGVSGEVRISCNGDPPTISIFSIATIEILKELLGITARDYMWALKNMAPFDEKVLEFDPGYVESLRCSHLFNSVCVVKGHNEIVKLGSAKIIIEKVKEILCKDRGCSSLEYPYDSYTLSLFYKLLTHVVGLFAQMVNSSDKTSLGEINKMLSLYIAWESKAVKDYLGEELVYSEISEAKPIMDCTTIKFYRIKLM
ncbi:MAG: hypothetical protein QXT53_00300 [Ignisphaera sp.]